MRAAILEPFDLLVDYERRSLAHKAPEPERDGAAARWRGIGFRVGARFLLVSVTDIDELLAPLPLTVVPGTQAWLAGIANVRGNLIPVVDLGGFLFGTHTRMTSRCRWIVTRQQGNNVGLLVEEVTGQQMLGSEQLDNTQAEHDESLARFVSAVVDLDGRQVGVFETGRLVRAPDFLKAAG